VSSAPGDEGALGAYLDEVRGLIGEELHRIIPADHAFTGGLYALVRDYPARAAKTLRPALAIATCRALGGAVDAVLPTAAALELYHNAFLIHDDVEDDSELRRGRPTLHREHGVPIAVNVGDAMLALSLGPLLENTATVGLGPALRLLQRVARMSRLTAEGQATELAWIRQRRWDLRPADYRRMVHGKTSIYSFSTPIEVGALLAGAGPSVRGRLALFAARLGLAFQIQDDLLNLRGAVVATGKEAAGDLWEGKRTLILLTGLPRLAPAAQARALALLDRPRPEKTEGEVAWLRDQLEAVGALDAAAAEAQAWAAAARRSLDRLGLPDSGHKSFLSGLVRYVVDRAR
jgi:geranylgeranyl diphosphate synthase type II